MGTGGINVQPQTGRESSGRIELINGPRGDISLTILLVVNRKESPIRSGKPGRL